MIWDTNLICNMQTNILVCVSLCRIIWKVRIRNLLQNSVALKWNQMPLQKRLNLTQTQVLHCLKSCGSHLCTSTNNWRVRWAATIQLKPKQPTHFQLLRSRGGFQTLDRDFKTSKECSDLILLSISLPSWSYLDVIWGLFSLAWCTMAWNM